MYKEQTGMTLVEILAALSLLSIVIMIFLAVFGKYALFADRVENELDAIHLAEEIGYYTGSMTETYQNMGSNIPPCSQAAALDLDYIIQPQNARSEVMQAGKWELDDSHRLYYTSAQNQTYYPVVKYCQSTNESDLVVRLHTEIYQLLKDGTEKFITETYHYIPETGESS